MEAFSLEQIQEINPKGLPLKETDIVHLLNDKESDQLVLKNSSGLILLDNYDYDGSANVVAGLEILKKSPWVMAWLISEFDSWSMLENAGVVKNFAVGIHDKVLHQGPLYDETSVVGVRKEGLYRHIPFVQAKYFILNKS